MKLLVGSDSTSPERRRADLALSPLLVQSLKHIDSAIQKANLPGISPIKHDKLSLRIPVSR